MILDRIGRCAINEMCRLDLLYDEVLRKCDIIITHVIILIKTTVNRPSLRMTNMRHVFRMLVLPKMLPSFDFTALYMSI